MFQFCDAVYVLEYTISAYKKFLVVKYETRDFDASLVRTTKNEQKHFMYFAGFQYDFDCFEVDE